MLRKTAKFTGSIFIILFGILGLFLPILPGIALIATGLAFISPTLKNKFLSVISKLRAKKETI